MYANVTILMDICDDVTLNVDCMTHFAIIQHFLLHCDANNGPCDASFHSCDAF